MYLVQASNNITLTFNLSSNVQKIDLKNIKSIKLKLKKDNTEVEKDCIYNVIDSTVQCLLLSEDIASNGIYNMQLRLEWIDSTIVYSRILILDVLNKL